MTGVWGKVRNWKTIHECDHEYSNWISFIRDLFVDGVALDFQDSCCTLCWHAFIEQRIQDNNYGHSQNRIYPNKLQLHHQSAIPLKFLVQYPKPEG